MFNLSEDFLKTGLSYLLEYYGLKKFNIGIFTENTTNPSVSLDVYYSYKIPKQELIDAKQLESIAKGFESELFSGIDSSPHIASIKAAHDREIQTLNKRIEVLERLNMNLSEAFTNGLEMLDEDCTSNTGKKGV